MRRQRFFRIIIGVGALVALQVTVIIGYLAVERRRSKSEPTSFLYEDVSGTAPAADVPLEQANKTTISLANYRGRLVILHFWATWCAPCRTELPALLALARELDGEDGPVLLAVSVDENWPVVGHFFNGDIPRVVVLDATGLARSQYDVVTLPETYFVRPDGRLSMRFRGAREWASREARDLVVKELARTFQ